MSTKNDLLDRKGKFVKKEEGEKLARQINANFFIECSAKDNINIQECVQEAVRATIFGVPQKEEKKRNGCGFCNFLGLQY